MKKQFVLLTLMLFTMTDFMANEPMKYRGIVYDVGLKYTEGSFSVDSFNVDLVRYDLSVIANILRANTVRIEGENINRLVAATKIANSYGLKVFFNPWKMNADEQETISYMSEAAKAAEKLRREGIDLVFVTGCEYSVFSNGIFEGNNVNERIASLSSIFKNSDKNATNKIYAKKMANLNRILANICRAVRSDFKGQVTYSSGTWEHVDWNLFDIVGVDYYRDVQTDKEYMDGIKRYVSFRKPVVVMEVGCCAYRGAAKRGGFGFSILQGTTADGNAIYEGGITPIRSEKEQADYNGTQIRLLNGAGIDGMFIFVFSFPIMPYRETGFDADMTSYSLVKTYPQIDVRSKNIPSWSPKESFYHVADAYRQLELSK